MNKKIILAVICTLIAFGIGASIIQNMQDSEKYSKIFYLDATFYQDKSYVQITFDDSSKKTTNIVLEVLGMRESYQKTFSGPHFEINVPFDGIPQYGWKTTPITLVVEHPEFGRIGLKTDVHNQGEPPNKIIFSKL
ncbi:MAG: hypothetical protein WAO91_07830 [Candidatus Nitrosotenuis sp.]